MTGAPIGSCPSPAAAKSCAVHFTVLRSTPRFATLPSERAFGPPGNKLCNGSTVNGSSSYVTLICSSASLASSSLSAATARIGWPTNSGSLVRIVSPGARGLVGDFVGRQHAMDAGHRKRRARVDARDARVRHGARQHFEEHHAVDTEILRVFGFAGHLRVDVGRREILAKQVVGHVSSPRWNARLVVGLAIILPETSQRFAAGAPPAA